MDACWDGSDGFGKSNLQHRRLLLYIPLLLMSGCGLGRAAEELCRASAELLRSFDTCTAMAPKEALADEADWTGTRREVAGAASWK